VVVASVGAVGFVFVLAILAVRAVPQFTKYMRSDKLEEATQMLDFINKGATMYYTTPRIAHDTGARVPSQFPATVGKTPTGASCCDEQHDADNDERCDPHTGGWNSASWSALKFAITDQHYFQYEFASSGVGAMRDTRRRPMVISTATAKCRLSSSRAAATRPAQRARRAIGSVPSQSSATTRLSKSLCPERAWTEAASGLARRPREMSGAEQIRLRIARRGGGGTEAQPEIASLLWPPAGIEWRS